MSDATLEHWFDRAVEDRLNDIINKYRQQGKDVNHVGGLRARVAADLNALRGTAEWAKLRLRYDPPPKNRLAWCCVCDKPVSSGSVSAWLEDKAGRVFCSQQCKDDAKHVFISLDEWKRRVKEKGSVTGHRKDVVGGEVVDGEAFTLTWDQVRDWSGPYVEPQAPDAAAVAADEIEWTDD